MEQILKKYDLLELSSRTVEWGAPKDKKDSERQPFFWDYTNGKEGDPFFDVESKIITSTNF